MELIELTGLDGQPIIVNPYQVRYIRAGREGDKETSLILFDKEFGINVLGNLRTVQEALYSKRDNFPFQK